MILWHRQCNSLIRCFQSMRQWCALWTCQFAVFSRFDAVPVWYTWTCARRLWPFVVRSPSLMHLKFNNGKPRTLGYGSFGWWHELVACEKFDQSMWPSFMVCRFDWYTTSSCSRFPFFLFPPTPSSVTHRRRDLPILSSRCIMADMDHRAGERGIQQCCRHVASCSRWCACTTLRLLPRGSEHVAEVMWVHQVVEISFAYLGRRNRAPSSGAPSPFPISAITPCHAVTACSLS